MKSFECWKWHQENSKNHYRFIKMIQNILTFCFYISFLSFDIFSIKFYGILSIEILQLWRKLAEWEEKMTKIWRISGNNFEEFLGIFCTNFYTFINYSYFRHFFCSKNTLSTSKFIKKNLHRNRLMEKFLHFLMEFDG